MNNELKNLSLDPTTYGSLISLTGTIDKNLDNNKYVLKTDDGVFLDITIHPKVVEAYDKQDYFIDESDEVDMLGCYVNIDNKPEIVILRCLVYNEPPTFVS